MLFAFITLFAALAMAGTAAWFAIVGIMAIFAGLPFYALIMGCVVELGKVVGVSWVYRNWERPTKIKYFMLPGIIVAMLLTSMGIFGLLSKAHIEQTAPVSNNTAIIERLDQRISREQRQIADAETVVAQLDETVQTLINYDRIRGADGAIATRENQREQRESLRIIIDEAQGRVDDLEDQKLVLVQELQSVELEVGPIKYIAELVYTEGETRIEDAVRWVIIAFIFVFDPMAILLLMAANYTLMERRTKVPPTTPEPVEETPPVASSQKLNDDLHSPPNEHIVTNNDKTKFKPNASVTFRAGKKNKNTSPPNHGMQYGLLKSEGKK